MLLLDVWKVPIWLSLAVIATSISVAVALSLRATRDLAAPKPRTTDSTTRDYDWSTR
jgi:tellurite resistance protein TerC